MVERRTWIGLSLLFVAALAVRAATVGLLYDPAQPPPAFEHGEIARNLLAGRGFSVRFLGQAGPTSQQAPLYPALLAGCYRLWGADSAAAALVMQALQCLAGAVTALVISRLTWRLLPRERFVGWWAGGWAALDPAQVYLATHLQVAVWAALLLSLTTLAALSVDARRRWPLVGLGALLGVLLLVEPIYALIVPLLLLAIGRAAEAPRRMPRAAIVVAGAALVTVAPWLVRNRLVHGQWVFVKSSFGYAFWQGNNPHSQGTDKLLKPSVGPLLAAHDGTLRGRHAAAWQARRETLYIDDVLLKPMGYREFVGLSEPQRSALLRDRALEFIRAEPAQYGRLCWQRLRYFLLFDETNPKAANRLFRAATVVWLMLLAVGLMAAGSRWRLLWPLAAMFVALTLFHALTITSVRFRLAAQPLTFAFCALAVAPPLARIAARVRRWWWWGGKEGPLAHQGRDLRATEANPARPNAEEGAWKRAA